MNGGLGADGRRVDKLHSQCSFTCRNRRRGPSFLIGRSEDVVSRSRGRGTVATGRIERGIRQGGAKENRDSSGSRPPPRRGGRGVEMFRKLLDQARRRHVGCLLRGHQARGDRGRARFWRLFDHAATPSSKRKGPIVGYQGGGCRPTTRRSQPTTVRQFLVPGQDRVDGTVQDARGEPEMVIAGRTSCR